MRHHVQWRTLFMATAGVAALVASVVMGTALGMRQGTASGVRQGTFLGLRQGTASAVPIPSQKWAALAAEAPTQAPTAQSPSTPEWQTAADGKMAFDVASVKPNKSNDQAFSNVALGPGDYYSPNGGFFTATNIPLFTYIAFAFRATGNQALILRTQIPKWVRSDRFDIQARAEGNPSKDQMRLMMRSLLADRFKLAIHHETRQLPVFALVIVKPGKTGPQLQAHPDGIACSTDPKSPSAPARGFPTTCGGIQRMPATALIRVRMGARNVTMGLIASTLAGNPDGADRPVLDQTQLRGTFDFTLEWTPEIEDPQAPGATFRPPLSGPTFLEALKEQLGLKLVPQTGPVDVLVVDHVEQPSPN